MNMDNTDKYLYKIEELETVVMGMQCDKDALMGAILADLKAILRDNTIDRCKVETLYVCLGGKL